MKSRPVPELLPIYGIISMRGMMGDSKETYICYHEIYETRFTTDGLVQSSGPDLGVGNKFKD